MMETTDTPGPISSLQHPRPLGSLLAAAQRLTSRSLQRAAPAFQGWQDDAWEMFDLVGEERFLGTTLAGRLAQARLFVAELDEDPTRSPQPVHEGPVADVFSAFGGTPAHRGQLIARLGVNLFVAGDGFFVGIPRELLPEQTRMRGQVEQVPPGAPLDLTNLGDLDWRMLSTSEASFDSGGTVTLQLGEGEDETLEVDADQVFLIRVWRPHPRRWWQADSPTRSSLPVLRELVGLTMHISAQVDSRLAGAGVLLVPQSAAEAIGREADNPEEAFTEALMEAMVTPIKDRSNASAVVPLVLTVPDESTDRFEYLSFATPLDAQLPSLRDEAIRRLALGQDAPPEILLGVGGMNHWGAWLVREDTISTHIEPPLALICDALTTQFLHPVLEEQGVPDPDRFVVWYDVSHMIMRPNRTQDAQALHAAGVISDAAYREAGGFDETDAPAQLDVDPIVQMALDMAKRVPSIVAMPGLPRIVDQLRQIIEGVQPPRTNTGQGTVPRTSGPPAEGGPPVLEPGENAPTPQPAPTEQVPVAATASADQADGRDTDYTDWLKRHQLQPIGADK